MAADERDRLVTLLEDVQAWVPGDAAKANPPRDGATVDDALLLEPPVADRTALREAFARQMERTGWSDFARDRTLADFDAALAAIDARLAAQPKVPQDPEGGA